MDSPAYEATNERAREVDIVRKIAGQNDSIHRLPESYGVGFVVFRNALPHAFVEARRCKNQKEAQETVKVSVASIVNGIRMAEETGVHFVLIVQWADVIGTLRIFNTDGMKMEWSVQDGEGQTVNEPVYHISSAHFAVRWRNRA